MMKQLNTNNSRLKTVIFFILFLCCAQFHFANTHRMGVITDIHYLSEQLMDNGTAINQFMNGSGHATKHIPVVLDLVLSDYTEENIDILLICGDLTKNGERQSHLDLRTKLQPLIDKGTRIFVIPGNHDINVPHAAGYKEDKVYFVETVSPKEFEDIYFDCGLSEAFSRDSASLSYVAAIDNNTWLLAVDASRYKEYKDISIPSGVIGASTKDWISKVLAEAKSKNKKVISMMHQGLVEHFPYQSVFFPDYLVKDWYNLAGMFADNGVKAIFTGHFHANDITEFTSAEGNKIYDIETSALCFYPFAYRYVTLNPNQINIETKNVTSIPGDSLFAAKNKEVLRQVAKHHTASLIRKKLPDISPDKIDQVSAIAAEMYLMHLKGDETLNKEIIAAIEKLSIEMNFPIDLSSDDFQFDFPPGDNSLQIHF